METSSTVVIGHRSLEDDRIYKLVLTGPFAALSHMVFTFLRIKTTFPGGGTTSAHLDNVVCVLGALILGGFYDGLGGVLGMTTGDLFDLVYMVYALEIPLLKFYIGLITGLAAHEIDRTNGSSDKDHVFRFVVVVPACGLLLNVIFDPLVGYYCKLAILGKLAAGLVLAWGITSTPINMVMSAAAAVVIYVPLRSILIRAGLFNRFR